MSSTRHGLNYRPGCHLGKESWCTWADSPAGEGSKPELTSDCPDFVFSGEGRQVDESRRKKSFRSRLSLRCASPSKLLSCPRRGRGDGYTFCRSRPWCVAVADHLKDSGSRDILYLPVELGLERSKRREVKRFGQARPEFLAWAAQYDEGGVPGRSVVVN